MRVQAWRRAFTLVEVIVALAVLLILAAVALPQMAGYLDQKRIEATANQLVQIRDALYSPGAQSIAFRQVIGANAGRLSQLSNPVTGADVNSCGNGFNGGQQNRWDDQGPYVNFIIDPAAGLATPIGQADNVLTRTPPNGGGASGTLRITWTNNVSLDDARALDLLVDGVAGSALGTVQWTPALGTNGVVTLYYFVGIDASC